MMFGAVTIKGNKIACPKEVVFTESVGDDFTHETTVDMSLRSSFAFDVELVIRCATCGESWQFLLTKHSG